MAVFNGQWSDIWHFCIICGWIPERFYCKVKSDSGVCKWSENIWRVLFTSILWIKSEWLVTCHHIAWETWVVARVLLCRYYCVLGGCYDYVPGLKHFIENKIKCLQLVKICAKHFHTELYTWDHFICIIFLLIYTCI